MTSFPLRCAALALLAVALTACQSHQQQAEPVQAAPAPLASPAEPSLLERFEASLDAGELAQAEQQLGEIKQAGGDQTQVLHAQRRLAEAFLRAGQTSLESGDLDQAAKSLAHARTLMPQAPALTTGLDGAIGKAREAELSATEQARQAGAQAQAARQEQLRLLRQAAEAQAAATRGPEERGQQPQARLIDPSAERSDISLAMLDSRDEAALFERLDAAAADIVNFNRDAHLEVRSAEDLRRMRALLQARVMLHSPLYVLRLSHAIKPAKVPHLILESK